MVAAGRAGLLGVADRSNAMTTAVAEHRGSDQAVIRPFQVNIPDAEVTDLRRRIKATRSG